LKTQLIYCIILSLAGIAFLSKLKAQVIVQFTTPPTNYRTFSDLWNISINNVSGVPLQFNAELTLADQKQSTLLTGKLQNLQLPAGLTLFSAENFNLNNLSFGASETATKIRNNGIIPEGSYGLCITLINPIDGLEIGRTCINFSVLQALTNPANNTIPQNASSGFMKNFQFHGYGEVTTVLSNTPGNFTNMPSNYMQVLLNPNVSIFDVPVNARLTLSTLNSSQSQNINAFSINFDGNQFKNVLKAKLIDLITKNNKLKDMNLSSLKGDMSQLSSIQNTLKNPDVMKELGQLKELDSLKQKMNDLKDFEKWKQMGMDSLSKYKERGLDSLKSWKEGVTDSLKGDSAKLDSLYKKGLHYKDSIGGKIDSLKEKGMLMKDSLVKMSEKFKDFKMEGSMEDNITAISQKMKGLEWLEQKRAGYEKLLQKKDEYIKMGQKFGLIDSAGNIKDVNSLKENLDYSKLSDPNFLYDKLKNSKLLRKFDKFLYGFKTVSFGLSNPVFSDLALKGVPVRGVFIEYEFKNFYAGFTYGQLQSGVNNFALNKASYTRNILAASIGYGAPNKTHIHITLAHAMDDSASIHPRDSIFISQKTPQDNYVMTVDFKLMLFKDKLRISGELAGSQNTRDIGSTTSPIINPIPGYTKEDWFTNIFAQKQVNLNTTVDFAFNAKVEGLIFKGRTLVSASIKRTGPNYYALGVPFLMRDMLSLEAKVTQKFWKNRISLMGFVRRNEDNLNNQKPMQSYFYNYGFDLSINIPKLPYFKANLLPVNMLNDSTRIDMLIFNASAGYNYNLNKRSVAATNLNYTYQDINYGDSMGFTKGHFITLNQLFTFNNTVNVNIMGSYYNMHNDTSVNQTFIVGAGAGFVMFKKLNTSAGGNLYISQRDLKWGAYLQASMNFLKYFNMSIRVENNMYNNYLYQPINPDYYQVLCRTILTARW
jgi:hypothetical protein